MGQSGVYLCEAGKPLWSDLVKGLLDLDDEPVMDLSALSLPVQDGESDEVSDPAQPLEGIRGSELCNRLCLVGILLQRVE